MALSGLEKKPQTHAFPRDANDFDSEGSSGEASENDAEGNAAWADCIAKVLNTSKPKTKKTLVLSRAKKAKPSEQTKSKTVDYGFEVEGEPKSNEHLIKQEEERIKQRKNVPLELRVKPSWKDIERERSLRKVATRGVVQLFNAVRIQQKDIQKELEKAGPLDSRKDAVLNNINKRKFLDVLMSGNRAKSEAVDNPVKSENLKEDYTSGEEENENVAAGTQRKRKSEWSVLRDDFMTNKKIKHWDEEDDEDNEALDNETGEDSGEE